MGPENIQKIDNGVGHFDDAIEGSETIFVIDFPRGCSGFTPAFKYNR